MGVVVRNTPFVVQSGQKTVLLGSGRSRSLSMRKKQVQLRHSGCLTGWIGVALVFYCDTLKDWKKLEGVLAQITEVYTGDSDSPTKYQKHYRNSVVAIGAIIFGPLLVAKPGSPKKKCKVNDMTNGNPEQNKDDDLYSSIISKD